MREEKKERKEERKKGRISWIERLRINEKCRLQHCDKTDSDQEEKQAGDAARVMSLLMASSKSIVAVQIKNLTRSPGWFLRFYER